MHLAQLAVYGNNITLHMFLSVPLSCVKRPELIHAENRLTDDKQYAPGNTQSRRQYQNHPTLQPEAIRAVLIPSRKQLQRYNPIAIPATASSPIASPPNPTLSAPLLCTATLEVAVLDVSVLVSVPVALPSEAAVLPVPDVEVAPAIAVSVPEALVFEADVTDALPVPDLVEDFVTLAEEVLVAEEDSEVEVAWNGQQERHCDGNGATVSHRS